MNNGNWKAIAEQLLEKQEEEIKRRMDEPGDPPMLDPLIPLIPQKPKGGNPETRGQTGNPGTDGTFPRSGGPGLMP
jgi:hypothetical protein